MREVLFRAKTQGSGGEWVYGYYCKYGKHIHKIHSIDKDGDAVVQFGINIATLCEYTGLTDKNGNKIFEGDILLYTDIFDQSGEGERYLVGIGECMALDDLSGYGVYIQAQDGDKMLLNADELTLSRLEVIGNIHDNPELLTDKT